MFGFHAQQAVGKALKGWLALADRELPRSHSIRHLIVLLEQAGVETDELWDFVALTAFAVQFRYEAFEAMNEPLDRPALLARVLALIERVERLIG